MERNRTLQIATMLQRSSGLDYWTSDVGQAELFRKIQDEAKLPTATAPWGRSTGTTIATLSVCRLHEASKEMLGKGSLSAAGGEN